MKYRVFCSEVELPPEQSQLNYPRMMTFTYETKELAMEAAFKLMESRAIVWGIDGPDKFLMIRGDVEREYWVKTGKWPRV